MNATLLNSQTVAVGTLLPGPGAVEGSVTGLFGGKYFWGAGPGGVGGPAVGTLSVTLQPLTMTGGTPGPVLPPPPWTIPEAGGHGGVIVIRRRRRW